MPRGVTVKLKKNHNLVKFRHILQYQKKKKKGKRQNEVIERIHKIF